MGVLVIVVPAVVAQAGILQRLYKSLPARLFLGFDDTPPALGLVHPRMPGPSLVALTHKLGAVVLAWAGLQGVEGCCPGGRSIMWVTRVDGEGAPARIGHERGACWCSGDRPGS